MTVVAWWQVVGADVVADRPLRDAIDDAARGELRLAASRIGADPVGEARAVEVPLWRVETPGADGGTVVRLEPAAWLRARGTPVPERPDGLLVRWEQDSERRPLVPLPGPRRGWRRR